MQEHWSHDGPPVYIAVAAYLGLVKKRRAKKPVPLSAESVRELASLFRAAGGAIN